jgi:hypothetical protein
VQRANTATDQQQPNPPAYVSPLAIAEQACINVTPSGRLIYIDQVNCILAVGLRKKNTTGLALVRNLVLLLGQSNLDHILTTSFLDTANSHSNAENKREFRGSSCILVRENWLCVA